jgi:hypothetical protein
LWVWKKLDSFLDPLDQAIGFTLDQVDAAYT